MKKIRSSHFLPPSRGSSLIPPLECMCTWRPLFCPLSALQTCPNFSQARLRCPRQLLSLYHLCPFKVPLTLFRPSETPGCSRGTHTTWQFPFFYTWNTKFWLLFLGSGSEACERDDVSVPQLGVILSKGLMCLWMKSRPESKDQRVGICSIRKQQSLKDWSWWGPSRWNQVKAPVLGEDCYLLIMFC